MSQPPPQSPLADRCAECGGTCSSVGCADPLVCAGQDYADAIGEVYTATAELDAAELALKRAVLRLAATRKHFHALTGNHPEPRRS